MPTAMSLLVTLMMLMALAIPAAPPPAGGSDPDTTITGDKDEPRDRDAVTDSSADADAGVDADDDEGWVERALAHPESDRGWDQTCQDDWGDGRVSYCEVREFPYATDGKPIAIDGGENSGMSVIGWNRNQVRVLYRIRTRARSLEDAKSLAKSVSLTRAHGWLEPQGPPAGSSRWWSVEIKAWVPHASDIALHTLNGPLGIRDVHGTMDLSATNGPVSLLRLGGAVVARAQNGPLHVELGGDRWDGKGLDAEAENGPVNLEIPRHYSARIETGTIDGPTDFSYPMNLNVRPRGYVTTTLGSGGPPVRVVTSNGPFRIARAD
jgi:hypothetical protein